MDFKELDENEFEKYIVNSMGEKGHDFEMKKELEKDVFYVDRQFSNLSQNLTKYKEYIDTGMYEQFKKSILNLSSRVLKLSKYIASLSWKYTGADKYEVISNVILEKKDIKFTYLDKGIVIRLPELLPHRPTVNVYDRSVQYYYDTDTWRESYYTAFREECKNGKMKLFTKKAILIIEHHVTDKKGGDIDNFDTKIITDIIADFLLIDDDHRHLCMYMDMVEEKEVEEYTEIILCAKEDMYLFIK